jgi:hypothetical protein
MPQVIAHAVRHVELPELGVRVPVPAAWEPLDPRRLAPLVYAAQQPDGIGFRPHLTVASDRGPRCHDPHAAGTAAAAAVPSGHLIAARGVAGAVETIVVHRVASHEVVTTQRIWDHRGINVTVAITWAVEQEPIWREEADGLLGGVRFTGTSQRPPH